MSEQLGIKIMAIAQDFAGSLLNWPISSMWADKSSKNSKDKSFQWIKFGSLYLAA